MLRASLKKQFLTRSAGAILLVMFCSIYAVDLFFRSELKNEVHNRLKLHIYSLLAVSNPSKNGLFLPSILTNPMFNEFDSSTWATIMEYDEESEGAKNSRIWQSLSSPDNLVETASQTTRGFSRGAKMDTGEWYFSEKVLNGQPYFSLYYPILWEFENRKIKYIYMVSEKKAVLDQEIQDIRIRLGSAFVFITAFLLIFQHLVLRRTFLPIDQLEQEIHALEQGKKNQLDNYYPSELYGVTHNLNALIRKEHQQRAKYRESMADLAHSLKTPLAVIRGELGAHPENNILTTALTRLDKSIEYQLQRAVISGHTILESGTRVLDVLNELITALEKVYANTPKSITLEISEDCYFFGDENDLLEVLGNLTDNAFKYSKQRINISASQTNVSFILIVEDDGPGIDIKRQNLILQRGTRLDQQGLGQGIGLAVVSNIVSSYAGNISVEQSKLGGAKFTLTFPTTGQS